MKTDGTSRSKLKASKKDDLTSSKGTIPSMIVRPLAPKDFEFVHSLSKLIAGYTVCPRYLLWMLTRFHGRFCAVAIAPDQSRLGYLLAMAGSDPSNTAFVWQLAVTFQGRRLKAQDQLASYLKTAVKARGTTRIVFTSVPNSAAERSVGSLAKRIFSATPRMNRRLPSSVSRKEREYILSLTASLADET